jgi:transposase
MKQKSGPDKAPAEQVLKNIRRQTRRQYSAEEKIRNGRGYRRRHRSN